MTYVDRLHLLGASTARSGRIELTRLDPVASLEPAEHLRDDPGTELCRRTFGSDHFEDSLREPSGPRNNARRRGVLVYGARHSRDGR